MLIKGLVNKKSSVGWKDFPWTWRQHRQCNLRCMGQWRLNPDKTEVILIKKEETLEDTVLLTFDGGVLLTLINTMKCTERNVLIWINAGLDKCCFKNGFPYMGMVCLLRCH